VSIGLLHKPIDDAYTFSMKNYRRFRSYCFRILSLLHKLLSMIFLYSSMIASLFDCSTIYIDGMPPYLLTLVPCSSWSTPSYRYRSYHALPREQSIY